MHRSKGTYWDNHGGECSWMKTHFLVMGFFEPPEEHESVMHCALIDCPKSALVVGEDACVVGCLRVDVLCPGCEPISTCAWVFG